MKKVWLVATALFVAMSLLAVAQDSTGNIAPDVRRVCSKTGEGVKSREPEGDFYNRS